MKTKVFLFVCLFMGVAVLFFGCSQDNSLVPDLNQNDELANSLKSKKIPTHFTGTSVPLNYVWEDGAVLFYENASNERVTGASKWYTTVYEQIGDNTFKLAGTGEIFVGAKTLDDVNNGNYKGKWNVTWKGTQILTSPDGSTFIINGSSVGTGTEGEVLGLTARWKFTMNFDGTPESFMYEYKGKIYESKCKVRKELNHK